MAATRMKIKVMGSGCPEHWNFSIWGLGFIRASCGVAGVKTFRIATRHVPTAPVRTFSSGGIFVVETPLSPTLPRERTSFRAPLSCSRSYCGIGAERRQQA
jgi:hypothetical protein